MILDRFNPLNKSDPDGNELWGRYLSGDFQDGSGNPVAVATDNVNNIIVTGYSKGSTGPDGYLYCFEVVSSTANSHYKEL